MTKNLRNYLKKLPYFLLYNYPNKLELYNKVARINKGKKEGEDKVQSNAFHSPTAMNELCDYICTWEKKVVNWEKIDLSTGKLLIDNKYEFNDRKLTRAIRSKLNEYAEEMNLLEDKDKIDYVIEKYQEELENVYENFKELLNNDKLYFINYCVNACYTSPSVNKSLVWRFYGDEMLENLKKNTKKSKKTYKKVVECDKNEAKSEFLGRFYKIEEVGAWE